MRGSVFIFDSVQLLYYKCHDINFRHGGSYTDSPNWIVSNNKPLISKYKWKWINYPSKIKDWKTFEKNNPKIAFNILCINEKEICLTCISKINLSCEKRKTNDSLNDSKWRKRRLALCCSKKISALLHRVT